MSNRVNVNINVNDHSRAGLAALRQNMNRMQRDVRRAGGSINFRVDIDPGTSRRDLRRIQRSLRGMPVTINTRLDPPTPAPRTMRQRILRGLGAPIRVPTRLATRGLVASARGPIRSLGGLVSGTLQDGVGQGLINGFKAGGPIGAAVLAAIILGSLSLIGAALSGLIVTALGAAFVGVAGVSAAMSERVKSKWSDVLGTLKEEFRSVGEPLIPVLERSLGLIENMAKQAGPIFREAMVQAAPATEEFINKLLEGFARFADQAFQPLMDAWEVFGPIFGQVFSDFLDDLGNSFGEMADLVRNHSFEIELALRMVFKIIDFLVDAITFFGQAWVFSIGLAGDAMGVLITIVQGMLTVILGAFDAIISGAAKAFGWIPGIGGKLKDANASFDRWREGVDRNLTDAREKAFGFDEALDRMNRTRTLKADIKSWQAKLADARASLKKTTSQKAQAKLRADISDLNNKIASARAKLNALNGKTSTTYIRTVDLGIGAEAANAARRAHGGMIGTAATGGIRGNLTMVGEQGPELVQLPTGSRVRSNPDTRRILGGSGRINGAAPAAALMIDAAGDDLSQLLLKILRHAIRDQGGDVQVVLGRG